MHPEQMLQRAPHSPMAGTGWLHGWRLTFGGEDIGWDGALATVVEDPASPLRPLEGQIEEVLVIGQLVELDGI